jgi:predicted TIM-barrel fold metal-dependent hydrolase
MAEDLESFAEQEPYWGLLIAPDPINHTEQGWATPERMLADMDQASIDKIVLLGESQQNHDNCVARNDLGIELASCYPGRVIPFAVLQPKAGQEALDELKRCYDAGVRGVGELGPYSQGFGLDDPDFLRIVEACIDLDIPLNLHVSEEIGHFYLGKSTTPLRHYHRLAQRYPELKLILAHWGGGLFFYEIMPEVKQDLKNVWYDMAASPLLFPTEEILRVALQCVDHRKILFGSDYPLLICRDKQSSPTFLPFLHEINALELSADLMLDIMGTNAARLLGLSAPHRDSEARKSRPGSKASLAADPMPPDGPAEPISRFMAVRAVAEAWPETRKVFDLYGLPWRDMPVPHWEPIAQAAASRGYGPKAQSKLLEQLNDAIA